MQASVRWLGALLLLSSMAGPGCSDDSGGDSDSATAGDLSVDVVQPDSGASADIGQADTGSTDTGSTDTGTAVDTGIAADTKPAGDLDPDPCKRMAVKVCNAACACGQTYNGGKCCYSASAAGGGTPRLCVKALTCQLNFVINICGDTTKQASLFLACESDLGKATCAVSSGKKTLTLPSACHTLIDCNSGPCKS